MEERKNREESEIRELKIIKHYGRPEYASYVKVGGLNFRDAAELFFSSEPEGMLVYRMCWWLSGFIVERVSELLDNYEEEEVGMMVQQIIRKEPPLMAVGFLQGMLVTHFNEETAELLEMLRLCESFDDRVYDCFMACLLNRVKKNDQLKHFLEDPEARKGVKDISGKDDSDM